MVHPLLEAVFLLSFCRLGLDFVSKVSQHFTMNVSSLLPI